MPRARQLSIILGLALLAPVAVAATTLINNITNGTANEVHPFANFDAPASAVGDFDKDGKPEIVSHNDNQYVYVMSTTSPVVLAEFRPDYPPNWGVRPINDVAVGDVDNDGALDVVVVTSAGTVCDFEYTPGWKFERRWCTRMDRYGTLAADAGAVLSDVDGDGRLEIFSQTEEVGLFAFNHDGSIRWSKAEFGGNAGAIVTDLENDGRKEVVFFGDGGEVKAFDASNGAPKWAFFANQFVTPASIPVAGAAADIDGDGKQEVVFSARHAPPGQTDYKQNHLMIFVLSHTGQLQSRWQPSWGNPMSYTHPVLIDVNGDGVKDILLQDWNTIGHKPGNWEKLGPANVFAYTHNGQLLWRTVLDNSWSNDDLAVADVDGDGAQEVLAIGYNGPQDGMWYLDLRTGNKESHVPVGSLQILRGPVAGNLDGSGKTSWAASISKDPGWRVYRTDAPCNVAFGGTQNIFGCKGGTGGGGGTPPPSSPPPTSPPPVSGTFSFSHRGGNEWWVEAVVTPKPTAVQAMDTNGPWVPLEFKSWGEWANSFRIEPGHQVRFRAQTGGTWVESCWYAHPSGVVQQCSSTGGQTGFKASFVNVRGNVWWVEADVPVSGGTLAGVDARLNGGAWNALDLKPWGSWAKSLPAPTGTQVEFRARATDGQTVQSPVHRWPPS